MDEFKLEVWVKQQRSLINEIYSYNSVEVWEDRECEEGMCSWTQKNQVLRARIFLSGSKVTCGEQSCGKENKQGSERDIVMNSCFFFSLEFYQRFRTSTWKTVLMSR